MASATGVAAATLQGRPRPSTEEHPWRRDAFDIPQKGTVPLWTKKFEPEDSEDKDSPLALQEREAAVAARHERWNLGAEFFMTEFQLTEVEYWYVMSLWWETERDWTPPAKTRVCPTGRRRTTSGT